MPRLIITIQSDLFDNPLQDASVRENLPIRTLITETRTEFNLPDDSNYSFRIESTGRLLDPEKTLEQQGVRMGEKLVLAREKRAVARDELAGIGTMQRTPLSGLTRPLVREDSTGKIFEITFQPAIIGRPDPSNPQSQELLAVNVGSIDGSKSVSRYHARLTEDRGQYYLESLTEHNPAYLNESIVRVGDKRSLIPGDKIRVGKIILTFGVRNVTVAQPPAPRQ